MQTRIAEIRGMMGLSRPPAAASGDAFAAALESTMATPESGAVTGADVVSTARKYLGTPYVFGGNTPERGLDCSGLVQRVYADLGVGLPRVARDQARAGTAVASLAQARPGDLLAFGSPVDHIGIYAGGGRMIVAPHSGDVVKVQDVTTTPTAIRRILPSATEPLAPASVAASAMRPAALTGNVPYADLFQQAAARYDLSPALLAAVAKVESGFNPSAVSRAGAQGLMQIMPATARGLGVDALDPRQAVDGAARLLSGNLRRFGDLDLALAAYNAGGGAVSRYGGIPPFPETQAYVPKVKAAMAQLTARGFA
ncbi:transglycosylase SLT domain-containing protein [Dactylosporangium roseum]|uniref:Transglycosylase SLT domain-containing protein n=2 Tax=Dactylosporangium roseum TaxID=47989 RepID=A0ABY5ZJ10_9ACTN|nr:transglycosylase SLT domain-containing protein [Dactylosporangium roseum]